MPCQWIKSAGKSRHIFHYLLILWANSPDVQVVNGGIGPLVPEITNRGAALIRQPNRRAVQSISY
jgi:hypothetical protein